MKEKFNKFNHHITINLIIILLLCISIHSYVLIKLKKYENISRTIINNEYKPSDLIKDLYNKYYSFLNVGNPPQKTEVQISKDYVGLLMKEDICLTTYFYNKNKSLSLSQTHNYDYRDYSKEQIVANDTIEFSFYNLTNNNISENKIQYIFIYNKINNTGIKKQKIEKEKEGKACLILGFKIVCAQKLVFCQNTPNFLKKKKIN